jgi:hypothetical protein
LLADYLEACQIESLSPKASAALSRRCLQGMIRNFWDISRPRLVEEIDALQERVDAQTWDALDSLRRTGNIGAHMEKDADLIVDVDPDEARLLLELIETLFTEWYVARNERAGRMQKIKAAATDAKKAPAASGAPAAATPPAPGTVAAAPVAAPVAAAPPAPAFPPAAATAPAPAPSPAAATPPAGAIKRPAAATPGPDTTASFGDATIPIRIPTAPPKKK